MKRSIWLLVAIAACTSEGRAPVPPVAAKPQTVAAPKPVQRDPSAEDFPMPPLPMAKVTLTDAFNGSHIVEVEVAATGVARTRGLMWRTSLEAGKGMLFIFPTQHALGFWMKNTLIPLDMIFINKDLKVIGVISNAEPKTMTSRGFATPALYVLEVPGGWAEKTGIREGSKVKLDGTMGLEVTP